MLAGADDRGHHADLQGVILQVRALFDMRFKVAAVACGVDGQPLPAGQAGCRQSFAQRGAAVFIGAGVDIRLGQLAAERLAAKEAAVMAFLVSPGGDVDAQARAGGGAGDARATSRP